jgi:hypothetical protein
MLAVAVVVAWLGFPSHKVRGETGHIVITPALIDCAEVFQGQPISSNFRIVNEGPIELTVRDVIVSCGCMALRAKNGKRLELPFKLARGKACPVVLTTDTAGRRGQHSFAIDVAADAANGASFTATAHVRAYIQFPLVAEPASLQLLNVDPSQPVNEVIQIGDYMPNTGIAIREVVSSHPQFMEVRLETADGPMDAVGFPGAKQRYNLHVTVTPDRGHLKGTASYTLNAIPTDAQYPKLVIPVIWRARDDTKIKVSPSGFTFLVTRAARVWEREIVVSGVSEDASIMPANLPDNIQMIERARNDGIWSLRFQLQAPASSVSRQEFNLAITGAHEHISVPVTFITKYE